MTASYHTPIPAGTIADDTTFNSPMSELDTAIGAANTAIGAANTAIGAANTAIGELDTAIGPLTSLGTTQKDSLSHALGWSALRTSMKNTLTSAVNSVYDLVVAAQTQLDDAAGGHANLAARLDSLVLSGSNVATTTSGTAAAGQKVVDVVSTDGFISGGIVVYPLAGGALQRNTITVTSPTRLTMTDNVASGGIASGAIIGMISISEDAAANAIPHLGTLILSQTIEYTNGGVFNIKAFGASPSASAAVNSAAIQAAIDAMAIEDAAETGDFAGTLLIPPGVFQINDTLKFQSLRGFKLEGAGHASRLIWTPTEPTKNMIEIIDCRDSRISDLQISTSGTCNAAINVYGSAGDGVPTHNLFENVMMEIGGAQYGFQIGGASPATDVNNDFMEFHNCEIYNYLDSGVLFVASSQAYNYLFLNCAFLGDGINSKYAVDCGAGTSVGGFSVIGGASANHREAAFRIGNTVSQPVLIQGHNEEGNNRFLVSSSLSQVEIKQCRLSASGVNADKLLITAGGTNAGLIIDNCAIGDGTIGGTVALIVARMNYGSAENAQKWGRFVFTNNTVFSTLDGTTWADWPFDNSDDGCILPTEMSGNLIITDIGTLVAKRLDINNGATGASLETYPFIQKVGGARVVRTTNASYDFTTFDSVPPYHIFSVICSHASTFKDKSQPGGDNLWLAGHTNWTATVGSSITFYYDYDNDRFIELGRSQY